MRGSGAAATAALPVLREVDRLLEGWSCDCSADCCDFALTGREPYLTAAEFSLLAAEVARQGRKLPRPRDDGRCPFLDREHRCTVYAARPMGCRTFFCDRAVGWGRFPRKELSAQVRTLEALSAAKGRPISRWL